jgi:hypothetical protein
MSQAGRRQCPACAEQIAAGLDECPFCGEPLTAAARRPRRQSTAATEGDGTGGLIPYKNAPALIAYYCGVFSLLACIPIFLPIPIAAVILGIKGLQKANAEPHVKGRVHAWIGIIGGVIFTIVGIVILVLLTIGLIGANKQGKF